MQFLKLDVVNSIATLTVNRPEALNALNQQVVKELGEALASLEKKFPAEVKGLIITGAGEKAFVAGADIREINSLTTAGGSASRQAAQEFAKLGHQNLRRLEKLPFPVIAAVNGFALGGGLELALACDFIYASENAKLGLPEVSLGLIPGFGGTVRLTRIVGENRAREMILSGNPLSASEALQIGLVNKVVPQSELLKESLKTMTSILSRGPLAVAAAKRVILEGASQALDQAINTEISGFAELFALKDTQEGTKAFLEKRKAEFKGH